MPTTLDRLNAVRNEIESVINAADAHNNGEGRDLNSDEMARVTALVAEGKKLRQAHDADRAARDAVREIGNLAEAGDAVKNISEVERTDDGRRVNPGGRTFGQLFTESAEFTGFLNTHARNGLIPTAAKGLNSGTWQSGFGIRNDLVTGASGTSAGALVVDDRRPGITDLVPFREPTIMDLITVGSTTSDTVEYVRVTSKTNNAAPVAEATTADLPTQDGSTGPLIQAAGGGYKPESAMALEVVSTTVKTLAHWIPVTKRAASDASQIMTLIDNFLMEGLAEEAEDQVIGGDGTGENFTGILNSGPLTVGSAGTDLDAIVDAIREVRVTGKRRPTAMVIHPNDWYSTGFLLAKDGNQNYMVGNPRASVDELQTLWGLQVVVSEAVAENTALVGDFRQAVLWEREGVQVTMTDSHADFFVRNLLAVLAEMRAAFGVFDPQAFCTVTAV